MPMPYPKHGTPHASAVSVSGARPSSHRESHESAPTRAPGRLASGLLFCACGGSSGSSAPVQGLSAPAQLSVVEPTGTTPPPPAASLRPRAPWELPRHGRVPHRRDQSVRLRPGHRTPAAGQRDPLLPVPDGGRRARERGPLPGPDRHRGLRAGPKPERRRFRHGPVQRLERGGLRDLDHRQHARQQRRAAIGPPVDRRARSHRPADHLRRHAGHHRRGRDEPLR